MPFEPNIIVHHLTAEEMDAEYLEMNTSRKPGPHIIPLEAKKDYDTTTVDRMVFAWNEWGVSIEQQVKWMEELDVVFRRTNKTYRYGL